MTWLSKCDLNKDDTKEHSKEDRKKAHKAPTLRKELQANKESWKQEMLPSLGKNTKIGCRVVSSQPWGLENMHTDIILSVIL